MYDFIINDILGQKLEATCFKSGYSQWENHPDIDIWISTRGNGRYLNKSWVAETLN